MFEFLSQWLWQNGQKAERNRCRLQVESLETRDVPSTLDVIQVPLPRTAHAHHRRHPKPEAHTVRTKGGLRLGDHTFLDPTAKVTGQRNILLGETTYVGPFAILHGAQGGITIGSESNVQDNAALLPGGGAIIVGDKVILAHGCTILGNARIGTVGGLPAFVGFNAVVNGATIEGDAMVGILARVEPGITIKRGMKVLPGKLIRTQEEADNPALGKVALVNADDRKFMEGVIHVNTNLAIGYERLVAQFGEDAVRGIGRNPGRSDFNPTRSIPRLAGVPTLDPTFRNRLIGNLQLEDTIARLSRLLGRMDSIRADEGFPFLFGRLGRWQDRITVHALEHTEIEVGRGSLFGFHVVIHGGEDSRNSPKERTRIGDNVTVGDFSVVFRSTIGNGCSIGRFALVDGSQLAPGTVVPDRAIIVGNRLVGFLEW